MTKRLISNQPGVPGKSFFRRKGFPAIIITLLTCFTIHAQPRLPNSGSGTDDIVEDLLKRLTIEEKIKLLHGTITKVPGERFYSGGVPRLGVSPIGMLDGPVGLRDFDPQQKTTAMPSTLSLSCTWDRDAARRFASVLASEMLYLDKHILFGPGLNLMRSPLCGRNFEYLGEDPFLAGEIGAEYIRAVQDKGVAACAKHFLANDIDYLRHFTSSNMDERTMREMHLLPFEIAIAKGEVWTIMSGNNLFNGTHVAENQKVTANILKDELGFDGVMLTDWRAAYDPVRSALGGTDMTTGFCAYVFGDGRLLQAVKAGDVSENVIDDKVRRVLRLYHRTGLLAGEQKSKGEINTLKHQTAARELAAEGMVLLKNSESLFPLSASNAGRILVTGPASDIVPAGTGSSKVDSEISVSPLAGIRSAFPQATVKHQPYSAVDFDDLKAAAEESDIILFFANGARSGEGMDLEDLELPESQSEMIKKLTTVHDRVAVIILSAGPVEMATWVDDVEVILSGWFAGQATGDAIADVISGRRYPGGKLSFSIGRKLNDYACHSLGLWPQKPILDSLPTTAPAAPEDRIAIHGYDADYNEGIFMGYRWFDSKNIEPLFPFGFGLSYTTFSLSKRSVKVVAGNTKKPEVVLQIEVANTGKSDGSEVVQVYVSDVRSSVVRPLRELKGFEKVHLRPGETTTVAIRLDLRSFAFWDEHSRGWHVEPGEFEIAVGNSSRNIAFTETITLK